MFPTGVLSVISGAVFAHVIATVLPIPASAQTVMVHQGDQWTPEARQAFYDQDQGSRIMPVTWMRALKAPDGSPFLADALARYGYIQNPAARESDFPVGFTVSGGTVGMTCAACHTREINVKGTAYRIDGGPAIVDFQSFLSDLNAAMEEALLSEASSNAFAEAVLGPDAESAKMEALKEEAALWHLRFSTLIERSLPDPGWGPSRLDAISMIFNRLTGLDLGEPPDYIIPDNMIRADVPTRYPFLWNAPRQDQTQWLGFAANGNSILALSRNLGQVYGVFGEFHPLVQHGLLSNRDFLSANSANFQGLGEVETLVERIGSPVWPWMLDHRLVREGRGIFERGSSDGGCVECHQIRTGKFRSVFSETWATPIMDVGTDARACQLLQREVEPGALAGAFIRVPGLLNIEIGSQRTRAVALLEASVLGAIVQDKLRLDRSTALSDNADESGAEVEANELPPEFQYLPEAFPGARELSLPFEAGEPGCAYEARVLQGIWAAAPYLHNGSVATLEDLLKPAAERARSFALGPDYDIDAVGLAVDQARFDYTLETTDCSDITSGNSRCGHEYGTGLSQEERRALLEYLKSL